MSGFGDNAVFLKVAFFYPDLALATGESPGANAFDFYAELSGSLQQGSAVFDMAAPAGWHQYDVMLSGIRRLECLVNILFAIFHDLPLRRSFASQW